MSDKKESELYAALGASSSKEGIHSAIGAVQRSAFFATLQEDVCGDPEYYSLLHADGAGTKSIVSYVAFKETGETHWFESLAVDSLVMNLDDIACVNAFEGLLLSNTIGRNRFCIPDTIIEALITGYRKQCERLRAHGIHITLAGGETADTGDLIRTIVVDSCLFARVKKQVAISTDSIQPGDCIVGLSSTGQASYEETLNSGIGSNGITLARHALINQQYALRYPEILDTHGDQSMKYQGTHNLFDEPSVLGMTVAEALASPTRTYAPVIKQITERCGSEVHGLIHCTGGGQTKICRFGPGMHYRKNALFPIPPIFKLIQKELSVPWEEMYAVFNMGHRLEVICSPESAETVIDTARSFSIDAQIIGRVEKSLTDRNQVTLQTEQGEFHYSE